MVPHDSAPKATTEYFHCGPTPHFLTHMSFLSAPSTPSNTLMSTQDMNYTMEDPIAEVARLKRTIINLKDSLSPTGSNKRP